LKHLQINDFTVKTMVFAVSICIIALIVILLGVICYSVYSGKSLHLEGFGQFAAALLILVLMRVGLRFILKTIRANKADLVIKIEMTPPLRTDEMSFDPSQYIEPVN
jgi:hypothetical protein